MAGVKGKSGGPRKNSGGARPGAGRKPKAKPAQSANAPGVEHGLEPQPHGGSLKRSKAVDAAAGATVLDESTREPLEFLEAVMNDPKVDIKQRIRAGIAAAQYRHTKRGDGGKKDEAAGAAKKAAAGKFGSRPAPLKVVGGRA